MSYTVYDTDAVIVDSWPYKDASRRLLVFSRELGRILVRAQAVRKVSSKLAPAVQEFAESELELVYGKSGWRLVGAKPQRNFYLGAQAGCSAMRRTMNLLTRMVPAQQSDRRLYELVIDGLAALSQADERNVELTEGLFVFRLLSHLGYAPDATASNLQRFTADASYQQERLAEFQKVQSQAVEQINQALANTQL
jgi:DNA repair protein RecO